MMKTSTSLACLLVLGFWAGQSAAERDWPGPDEDPGFEGDFEDIPAYPRQADLLKIGSLPPRPQFEYWVDEPSLSVHDDGVVRYSLVVTAKSGGASNVRYEGIRCTTEEYKTYAYGGGNGPLKRARRPQWLPIRSDANDPARMDLKKFYFCVEGQGRPKSLDEILSALRYGPRDAEVQGFLY